MTTIARKQRSLLANLDWTLFISMLMICCFGLSVLYSAGYNPETGQSYQMKKQLYAMCVGTVAFLIAMSLNPTFFKRWAWVFYGLALFALALLDFGGITVKGSRRWLDLGSFRMQPSEFMKLGIILAFARYFDDDNFPHEGLTFKTLLLPLIILFVPVVLILVQPDLGTALVNTAIGGTMLLLVGIRPKTLLILIFTGCLALIPAWSMLKDYQRERVVNFLNPENDPLGTGYHAIQSKIAVGSGGLTGKGFLQGTQTQLSFLPEETTDFIFSVLAEERGFVGTALALILYGFLVFHALGIAERSSDRFSALVVVGVAAMLFWHVVMNIGMVIGLLPVVGVTLPLLSYGGSSVVTIMSGLGLVAGIRMRRFLFS
ncbi:rod shape-determining protein RodA [bacterium]|nr:rod shape-determining protein RodA [bacterium]